MNLFPHFPLHINPIVLFGLIVLLGLIGGELVRFTRILPRIFGYIAVGFLCGPSGFNIVKPSLLVDANFFVDIAIGIILFDLGRRLDINWIYHDRGILPMAFSESCLTFCSVFLLLTLFHFNWLHSALASTIAMATSPAAVMMVAHDLSSKGPVTRRTMMLTSLNNLFALVIFSILLPLTHQNGHTVSVIIEAIGYRLLGSTVLGLIVFSITVALSRLTGKNKESQLVLFVGAITFCIGLAISLNLSTMLTLFVLGVAARNLDFKYNLMEIDFGWLARLFFVLLFVITGVYLTFQGLWQATALVLTFIAVRAIAKIFGVWIFGNLSRLTKRQTIALGLALTPMAELAVGMSNRVMSFNPDFGYQLFTITAAVVAIFYILGPIATQIAFIKTNEVETPNDRNL